MAAIIIEDLKKSFGDVQALKGISFEVKEGSVFGLLGQNGAGKTTTVRILSTILEQDSGIVKVNGYSLPSEAQKVRESIGLAGQYAAVDELLTGRENLRMIATLTHVPKKEGRARTEELLELFDLTEAGNRQAKNYSGGMRRRLDLAASLVHAPDVLFLDEPSASLDPVSRNDLWNIIEALAENGTTVLLTSHDMQEVDRLADDIAIVDHGEIVISGSPESLKSACGVETLDEVFLKVVGHGIKEEEL